MEMEIWNVWATNRIPEAIGGLTTIIAIWVAARFSSVASEQSEENLLQSTRLCIGYKNILVNLDDAPKVERTYRSGDLHHERAQRATYSSETLENGSG